MTRTTKIIVSLILAIFVLLIIVNSNRNTNSDVIKVGAIIPMTGPNAVYGEQLKFGMQFALSELDKKHTISIRFEDSAGDAKTGVSAFNKLLTENTDVFTSSFSRVSVPLKELAKQNNKPLVMTIVSAMSAVSTSTPSIVRIFHNADTIVSTHIKTIQSKGFKKIGIIYTNDEFGTSVNDSFKKKLSELNILVVSESFASQDNDFRTQIQKIKALNVDAVVFVTIPPTSLQSFIKQAIELGINKPLIDGAGVLPGAGAIKLIGSSTENIYTFATQFDLNISGQQLTKALKENDLDVTYAAAFGYDIVKYILQVNQISQSQGISFNDAMLRVQSFDGIQGQYDLQNPEIQPTLIPVQVKNGKFEEVK